jgi:DNA topoisomerase-1
VIAEKVGKCSHYLDDAHLSIRRKKVSAKRFFYFYSSGRKVTGKRVLNRILSLAVPPNWQETRISKDSKASVQAVGYDEKGRKQYIYHRQWHEYQQKVKFARLNEFGNALPAFREYCYSMLVLPEWTIERACSLVCLLLDYTGARVGNAQYSKTNQTFGITTLRRKHIDAECDDYITLSYRGKHSKERNLHIDDPKLVLHIRDSAQQQGYCLFRYKQRDGSWHNVTSEDVNAFIHKNMGRNFSCKDFRTWAASRFALLCLDTVNHAVKQVKSRNWQSTLSKNVAKELGNTAAVCRKYYIHPKLLYLEHSPDLCKKLCADVSALISKKYSRGKQLSALEKILLNIISSE